MKIAFLRLAHKTHKKFHCLQPSDDIIYSKE